MTGIQPTCFNQMFFKYPTLGVIYVINNLLTSNIRYLRENLKSWRCRIDRAISRGLKFSLKDRTFEVNKLFIVWLFALVWRTRNRNRSRSIYIERAIFTWQSCEHLITDFIIKNFDIFGPQPMPFLFLFFSWICTSPTLAFQNKFSISTKRYFKNSFGIIWNSPPFWLAFSFFSLKELHHG